MTPEFVFSQGVAVAILAGLGWFGARELWPWLRDRSNNEQQHRHEQQRLKLEQDQREHDRQHQLETRRIETDGLLASAISILAEAVQSCPTNTMLEHSNTN